MSEAIIPTCKHIKDDGKICQSPAMRGDKYCYFHHPTRIRYQSSASSRARNRELQLPIPDSPVAIQRSINEVLNALLTNRIDPQIAGRVLFGLQTASLNTRPDPDVAG